MPHKLQKLFRPIYRRIRLLLRRGVLTGSNSVPKMQTVQVQLTPDLTVEMEHFEPYGFTSRPLDGAEPIVGNVEGKSHPVALLIADRRYRIQSLAKGEVAFGTDEGDFIHFKRGNQLEINSAAKVSVIAPVVDVNASTKATVTSPSVDVVASTKVTITTPACEITGLLTVGGNVNSGGQISDVAGSMGDMRSTFNSHDHPGDSGGTTGAPNQSM